MIVFLLNYMHIFFQFFFHSSISSMKGYHLKKEFDNGLTELLFFLQNSNISKELSNTT